MMRRGLWRVVGRDKERDRREAAFGVGSRWSINTIGALGLSIVVAKGSSAASRAEIFEGQANFGGW
jgi:hypothetical protein